MVLRKAPRDDPRVLPPAHLRRQTRTLSTRAAATTLFRARDASFCEHPFNGLFHGLHVVRRRKQFVEKYFSSPALSLYKFCLIFLLFRVVVGSVIITAPNMSNQSVPLLLCRNTLPTHPPNNTQPKRQK